MNEQEWLECADPQPMLESIRGTASDRKLRLSACAFCRRAPRLFAEPTSQKALDLIENFSDGKANERALWALLNLEAGVGGKHGSQVMVADVPAWWKITMALREAKPELVTQLAAELNRGKREESAAQARILNCVFGNPFRPVAIDPACLTPRVQTLAQSIYADRRFGDMPLLADALAEAGCTDADILDHCRQPGDHVRGCWVVDLLLGKK